MVESRSVEGDGGGDGSMTYPEPPEVLRRGGLVGLARFFGPGAIIASVTIGSGETVFASRGGAVFGYGMLWCFVVGGLMKFVQVYTAARFATLTGEHPIERWRYLPGPQGWAVWVLSIITILCFPLWLSGLPKMLGGLTVWIGGLEGDGLLGDPRFWGTAFAGAAITLTMVQSYAALERMQTIIVGILLVSIFFAAFLSKPDWLAALYGTLVPSIPAYQGWLVSKYPEVASRSPWIELGTYLGAIGVGHRTTSATSACSGRRPGVVGTFAWCGEGGGGHHRNRRQPRARSAVAEGTPGRFGRLLRLHRHLHHGLHDARCLSAGDRAVRTPTPVRAGRIPHPVSSELPIPLPGRRLHRLFGTILGAYELYVRTTYECLLPIVPKVRQWSLADLRPWVVAYCGIGGIAIMWSGADPVQIVTPAAIFGGRPHLRLVVSSHDLDGSSIPPSRAADGAGPAARKPREWTLSYRVGDSRGNRLHRQPVTGSPDDITAAPGPGADLWDCVEAIQTSGTKVCLAVTGGGSRAVTWLLNHPGASRAVLDIRVPYSDNALESFLKRPGPHPVSAETARLMALRAYECSMDLHADGDMQIGLSCTAALSTNRQRRGEDRAAIAVRTGERYLFQQLFFEKSRSQADAGARYAQEDILSACLISALAAACGLPVPDLRLPDGEFSAIGNR